MQVSVILGKDLTEKHVEAWSEIQSSTPVLESPFFRPEFTLAVSKESEDVFVGILHEPTDKVVGFFPFQLVRPGFGRNLEMCDYQGVIAPATLQFDAADLIRSCRLKVWEFDHLAASNLAFQRYCSMTAVSPIIDVSHGYEGYKASLNPEGRRHVAKAATSARKVQRELGELRLVCNSTDSEVMQTMHRWRAQKYGPLAAWAHRALETIRTTNTPAFAGVLSALYAGGQLLAVHFGIRSRGVLHWWFPAYNPDLRNYAPGILLLLNMAERGTELGISRIDLGRGLQDYKRRFGNASATVATGSVDLLALSNLPRIIHRNCSSYIRNTPALLNLARQAKRLMGMK